MNVLVLYVAFQSLITNKTLPGYTPKHRTITDSSKQPDVDLQTVKIIQNRISFLLQNSTTLGKMSLLQI